MRDTREGFDFTLAYDMHGGWFARDERVISVTAARQGAGLAADDFEGVPTDRDTADDVRDRIREAVRCARPGCTRPGTVTERAWDVDGLDRIVEFPLHVCELHTLEAEYGPTG